MWQKASYCYCAEITFWEDNSKRKHRSGYFFNKTMPPIDVRGDTTAEEKNAARDCANADCPETDCNDCQVVPGLL
jgi:hypothetical protein